MKSTILSFALCALCAGATAQTVTVADVEAMPGETVAFTLNLTGGKANTYTAMQFDAHFPTTGFSTTGKYNVSELWENATATIGTVDADGVATIPVASSESISAANVEGLFSVSFTVGSDVATGEYDVTLKNLWFGYGTSSKDYLDDVTFKVNVVAAHAVVLDENSTTAPLEAAGVNVTVIRTINADEWSTICLPFAMTAEQVEAAFGSDTQIADFTGYDTTEDDEENIVGITVNFNYVTEMEANHPYLIKVREKVTQFAVNGVTIEPEDYPQVSFGFTTGKGSKAVYHPVDFNGTYVADFDFYNDAERRALFLNGNKFYYATENTRHIKAFRAYFDFDDVLASVDEAGARIAMRVDDSGASGIYQVTTDEALAPYLYDLKGRRVGVGRSTIKKGLYIRNGRKEVVR